MTKPLPLISIIIVTYHNESTIEQCLTSIKTRTKVSFEIILVDNSSDRQTFNAASDFKNSNKDVAIEILRFDQNIGFAKGCNTGADRATGNYLMFLNPDTCFENAAADILINTIESTGDVVMAGPKIITPLGATEKTCRNLPTLLNILLDITGLDNYAGRYRLTRMSHEAARFVQQIIGACILVRRSDFFRLGRFDERFFVYFEEVDICKRALDSGLKILFSPEARVKHFRGISCESEQTVADMIVQLRKSRALYFKKHFSKTALILINLLNVAEGISKGALLFTFYLFSRDKTYRLKSEGFFRTALCLNF